MENLPQILLLLGVTVAIVILFQCLRIPTSLGYLLVGVLLGPFTIGPAIYVPEFAALAEFGVVFLMFTIGLNYSLPQIHALKNTVLGLGTSQVLVTTIVAAIIVWLLGTEPAAAFVVGAVFAQSSTTIISSLLNEQHEDNSQHGRLALAMSVFQDVMAVPFLVIIPVLGISLSLDVLGIALGWAFAKAMMAFALLFFVGRWLLKPLFHLVAARRSAEIFTLAVLLVALWAAWTTSGLGLSLAFGGFLSGMMLGDTEFRHQVESSIRPFRDVLLGLFFIGIGMRFNPATLLPVWHWALLGTLLILMSKTLIVTLLIRYTGIDWKVALRTGLLLATGGEFGLALVAIALDNDVIDADLGQVLITAILLAMIVGALLIRFNAVLAGYLIHPEAEKVSAVPELNAIPEQWVVIGGYGRVGQTVATLMTTAGIPFMAFDTDPEKVAQGRRHGHLVAYGNIADPELQASIHVERASLVVITIDQAEQALRAMFYLHRNCPQVPVVARARDSAVSTQLLNAGATHAVPEAIEASLYLGETALKMLHVSADDIQLALHGIRGWGAS